MLEQTMQEALTTLQTHPTLSGKYMASAVTNAAVVDADVDGDGKHDDNPDKGHGEESGSFTIMIYPVWEPPASPPSPVLVLNEAAVHEHGWTTAAEIVAHVVAQLK